MYMQVLHHLVTQCALTLQKKYSCAVCDMPFSSFNPFYSWLKKQNYWVYANGDNKLSHLFLDGGKACVPPDAEDSFICKYAEAILSLTKQYTVEVRTPQFRLFMDLDIKFPSTQTETVWDDVMSVIAVIQSRVSQMFADTDDHTAVVCTTPVKKLDEQVCKLGLHIIWSFITVNAKQAMDLRETCIARLSERPAFHNAWTDVIDASVYRPSSGLRMVGSYKTGAHDEESPAVYMPAYVVHRSDVSGVASACLGKVLALGDGEFMMSRVPDPLFGFYDWVRLTSIRTHPVIVDDDLTFAHGRMELTESSESYVLNHRFSTDLEELDRSTLSFINEHLVPLLTIFAPFSIKRAFRIKKREVKYILCTNSRRCLNLRKKCHNSNHIYFLCDVRGVHQRCFCTCATKQGRIHGYCRNAEITVLQTYPSDISLRLFGDKISRVRVSNKRSQSSSVLDAISSVSF